MKRERNDEDDKESKINSWERYIRCMKKEK